MPGRLWARLRPRVCPSPPRPAPPGRDEIAGCIEKAYEKILFNEATRILFFNTPKKMTEYAKKVRGRAGGSGEGGGWGSCHEQPGSSPCRCPSLWPPPPPQRGWILGPSNYYSFSSQQQKPEDTTIPSTELAKQVIEYARQLEMIV